MITFNNTLKQTSDCLLRWSQKEILTKATIIRDVQGKISLLLENNEYPEEIYITELQTLLQNELQGFFADRIFWKKISGQNRKFDSARIEIIANIVEENRTFWKQEEKIDFYLAERPIAKKAWVNIGEIQEAVWPYDDAIKEKGTKVVTFYSFKGGMGRTTALAGVALTLVSQGKNVMMVDMDVEAPGLSTLFFDDEVIENGVLDYLIEHPISKSRPVKDYILSVTDSALMKESDGNLYLMPAGKVDDNYLQKLARIDYQDNRENSLKLSLCEMIKEIKKEYEVDYILIDARAGFHDMGGVAVSQIPHGAVLLGNGSKQSWDGMVQVLRTIAQCHKEDFSIMIVDSMCERPTSEKAAEQKQKFLERAYTACVENYYDREEPLPGIDADGVEHHPEYIPFDAELVQGFELFSSGNRDKDDMVKAYRELLTGNAYKSITERIKSWFGE